MKKILFILSEYPPRISSTALAASLVIEKVKNNYEVYCLSLTNNGEQADKSFSLYYEDIRKIEGNGFALKVRQVVMSPIYPVMHPLIQRKLNKTALKICLKEKIDCVVSCVFPMETAVAGKYIKKKCPQIKFIPYFIDAYSCGTVPKYLSENFAIKRKTALESEIVEVSDRVIAMESSRKYHEMVTKYRNVCYLNPAFLCKPKPTNDLLDITKTNKINIVYAGYLYYPDRNPSYILHALSSMKRNDIRMIFIGNMDEKVKEIIKNEQSTFHGELVCYGKVSHDELVGVLSNSNIYLNLGVSNANAISGKIFEYMSYGKPIITTFFDENEASLPYMNNYKLSCCINQTVILEDEAGIILDDFINSTIDKQVNYDIVKRDFYSSTADAFIEVLDETIGDK